MCFDRIKSSSDCLVYAFGAGKDVSFENTMAEMGCRVRLFDPSMDRPGDTHIYDYYS